MLKLVEDLIVGLLELVGINVAKLALGELFSALVVAFIAWFFLCHLFVLPIRMFVDTDKIPNPTVELIEKCLVVLAFIISFGVCLYEWAVGF